MHLFDPHRVFRELYETACSRAACEFKPGYKSVLPPAEIVRLISDSMFTQFAQFQALGTSLDWHREQLAYNSASLAVITSRETCFSCIRRRPKYNFPCGHFICEHCIRTFCHADESDPWLFLPDVCLICSVPTPGLSIRLIPDTCRTRVLSIDGGGVRGAAPIGFLKAIEDEVGIPGYKVQRLFDVKIGTSSGALAVTSLDVLGWSIEDCMTHLKKFAEAAFPRSSPFILRFFHDTPIFPTVARLLAFLHACLTDSKYPSVGLEKLLMDTYGSACQITGISNATEMGTHVGVTLTRADDGQEQPTVRAATAAPYYFPPEKMNSHGKFQDGGITHNNPACIAIREAIALSHDETEPSIVVSLGTGSGTNTGGEPSGMFYHWFPLRLWRALWKPTESKNVWKHLRSHYNQTSSINFYRFDLDFAEDEPLLDEVDKMDGIWETAHQNIRGSPDLRTLCRRFRAEFFLFELDERYPPHFSRGAYQCTGHISCRLRAKTPEYEGFMQQLCSKGACIQLGGQVLEFTPEDVQKNIRFSVHFSVPCLDSPFSVKLVEEGQGLDISGSPFTAKWLIRRQGLDMNFGTTDHRKRRAFESLDEREPKRRKRWVY
ncbi:hypothetical protein FALBO_5249 [Fusarium albosuccineum]|uniref:PNPLA domain-containing protein n=1 Tax=Fusarium albosuccineum TaxID=1237068 RepID=A0A8H4PA01_9HYPO|nr:hypothetical protein FALBO_5249 [Fusarium albosuccineum]